MTSGVENERLPTSLGWQKKADVIALADVASLTGALRNATVLTTGPPTTVSKRESGRFSHFGLGTASLAKGKRFV